MSGRLMSCGLKSGGLMSCWLKSGGLKSYDVVRFQRVNKTRSSWTPKDAPLIRPICP